MVLRTIFAPKRADVKEGWRKLHNEELHNLYTSLYIIRVTKSRLKWAGHVLCVGDMRHVYKILIGKPEGKNHLDGLGICGRIILKCISGFGG
jgi:hypothetical protein